MKLEGFQTMNEAAEQHLTDKYEIGHIAMVCHEANRAYCRTIGDNSQQGWNEAPVWQRQSAMKGVEFCVANPDASPSANHESWLKEKESEGWKYGEVKDVNKKEHPCYVPYDQLPEAQKAKDALFKSIVGALAPYLTAFNKAQAA